LLRQACLEHQVRAPRFDCTEVVGHPLVRQSKVHSNLAKRHPSDEPEHKELSLLVSKSSQRGVEGQTHAIQDGSLFRLTDEPVGRLLVWPCRNLSDGFFRGTAEQHETARRMWPEDGGHLPKCINTR
jgi:hypothetical protein